MLSKSLFFAATFGLAYAAPAQDAFFYYPHTGNIEPADEWKVAPDKAVSKKTLKQKGGAGPTFNIVYLDVDNNTGVGFDDPTFGADRRATFEAALTYIQTVIDDVGSCDIEVQQSQTDGSGFLGQAGTLYLSIPNSFQPGLAFSHITTGADDFPTLPDIRATFDFGFTWNNEQDAALAGEVDLFSVSLHEITHGLGVASFSNSSGGSDSATTGLYTRYDNLLYRISDGTKVWNAASAAFQINASDLEAGNDSIELQSSGAAFQYPGGVNPRIDTLNPFNNGSSISHFQTSGSPAGTVMLRSISNGVEKRSYTFFEANVLQQLGYSIDAAALPVMMDLFNIE